MSDSASPYKVIEEKIRFHRKRAQYHKERANNWDRVLAQIQALQRQEQPLGRVDDFDLAQPEPRPSLGATEEEAGAKAKARADARAKGKAKARAREIEGADEAARTKLAEGRAQLAREVLRLHAEDGVLPVDIRTLANKAGISTPSNYPYKLLTRMVAKKSARRDRSGRYYPIGADEKK